MAANCGMSTQGKYISTLTLTDVYSGWTENRTLLNKAQRWVKEAVLIKKMTTALLDRKTIAQSEELPDITDLKEKKQELL